MQQNYANNTEYEILTPNGWENFEGIIFNKGANKESRCITFEDGTSITATNEHRFFSDGSEVKVSELCVNDYIDSNTGLLKIININELVLSDTFDIFNADNHVIIANNVYSHQCDEIAFIKPNIINSFIASITPTLSRGGKFIITSTPNGDGDKFSEIWKKANITIDEYGNETDVGINGFKAFTAHWSEHPDQDEKWAARMRAELGDEKWEREIECKFITAEETLIGSIKLGQLKSEDPLLKAGQVRYYRPIDGSKSYVLGWDPSLGTGGDNAAIQVFQLPEMLQVAEWQHNKTDIRGQLRIIRDILAYIDHEIKTQKLKGEIYWSVENNSIGEAALMAITDMGEENIPGIFLSEPGKARKGFATTHKAKIAACSKFKYWIESDKMKVLSKNLIREMKNFIASGMSFAAKTGETDDLVMATLLVVRLIQVLVNWDQNLFERLQEDNSTSEIVMPMPIGML